jgi:hypothetical protein
LSHLEVVARGAVVAPAVRRGIDRGKETVQGVWIEEYYKPMQEALKKAAQAARAESPKKKHFTFRYWITTKDANAEGIEFIKYAYRA